MLLKTFTLVRNNLKKTIFFTGVSIFCADYLHTSYKINFAMKNYCKKAQTYGNKHLSIYEQPRHLTVILNPVANKQKCRKNFNNYVAPILHCAGIKIDIFETENQGHVINLMESINNTDGVLIAGGSGTIHEAISGLLKRNDDYFEVLPIGILPLGNSNKSFNKLFNFDKLNFEKNSKRFKDFKVLVESTMRILDEKSKEASVIRIYNKEKEKSVFALNNFELGLGSDLSYKLSKYWYLGNILSKYYLLIKTVLFKNLSEFQFNEKFKIMYTETCNGCSKCYEKFLTKEIKEAKLRSNKWSSLFRSYSDKRDDYLKLQVEDKLKKTTNNNCGVWKEIYLDDLLNIEIKNDPLRNENYLTLYIYRNNNLTKLNLLNYSQSLNHSMENNDVEIVKARDIKFKFAKLDEKEQKNSNPLETKFDGIRIDSELYDLQENIEINSMLKKLHIYS